MDDQELDFDSSDTSNSMNQEVRKNIPLKLKSPGRGRGRGRGRKKGGVGRGRRKKTDVDDNDTENDQLPAPEIVRESFESNALVDRHFEPMEVKPTGPPEPTKLNWDHKVNLIGEKVVDPLIHCCEKCTLPILIYGRMLPCRHVFCFDCAKQTEKTCPRCKETVTRIEQSALGTVFVCTFGGSKHGSGGCRRTYLSQRDLQAHMNHRHMKQAAADSSHVEASQPPQHGDTNVFRRPEDPRRLPEDPRRTLEDPRRPLDDPRRPLDDPRRPLEDPRQQPVHFQPPLSQGHVRPQIVGQQPLPPVSDTFSIPVMSNRGSNLISVPIQDESRQDFGRQGEPPSNYLRQQPVSIPFDGHQHFSQGPPMGAPVVSPQYSTAGQPQAVPYTGPPINHPGAPPIHHGGPPPRWASDSRPITSQYNPTEGHSTNMTWSGQPNRGPPPNMATPAVPMAHVPPPRGQYYQ